MQRYFLLYLKEWRTDRKKESQSAPAANWPYSQSYLTSFQCWVYSSDCEDICSPFIYIKHQFRNWVRIRNEAGGLKLIGRSMIKYPSDFAASKEWQRNFPIDKYALHSNSQRVFEGWISMISDRFICTGKTKAFLNQNLFHLYPSFRPHVFRDSSSTINFL